MTNHPFISTRGLREPLEEEVEPTPQEKFDHAMQLIGNYGMAVANFTLNKDTPVSSQLNAHKALSELFADIYKLDEQ